MARWFDVTRRTASDRHVQVYGRYEKAYTVVDFLASGAFLSGSVLTLTASRPMSSTWLYLVGSVLFGSRPTVSVLREFHLARLPLPGDAKPHGRG